MAPKYNRFREHDVETMVIWLGLCRNILNYLIAK